MILGTGLDISLFFYVVVGLCRLDCRNFGVNLFNL